MGTANASFASKGLNMKVAFVAIVAVALFALSKALPSAIRSTDCFKIYNSWDGGYTGAFLIKSDTEIDHWSAEATFDNPFNSVNIYNAENVLCSGTSCTFTDKGWNGKVGPDSPLELGFMLQCTPGQGIIPNVVSLKINGAEVCG